MNRYSWRLKRHRAFLCNECETFGRCRCSPSIVIQKIVPYASSSPSYAITPDPTPTFVGRMPIRTDLEVLPVDSRIEDERKRILLAAGFDPIDALKLGWVVNEMPAIAIFNVGA